MGPGPPKKRRSKRTLLIVLTFFALLVGMLYFVLTSPRFLLFLVKQINHAIPGEIVADSLNLDLEKRTLRAKNLRYQNEAGETALSVDSLDLSFALTRLFRGNLEVRNLKLKGLSLDLRRLPKKEGPSQWRAVLQLILKRLSISESRIEPIDIQVNDQTHVHLEDVRIELTPQVLQNQKFRLQTAKVQAMTKGKQILSGPLSFDGEVGIPVLNEYAFFVDEADGGLKVEGVFFGDIVLGSLETRFEIDGDEVSLAEGKLINPHGVFNLEKVAYNPKKSSLELEVKNPQPISFQTIPKASQRLLDTFSAFKLDLKAAVTGLHVKDTDGKVELSLEVLGNRAKTKTPDAKLALKGKLKKGVLTLDKFEIHSEKTELHASGAVDFPRQGFDTKVKVRDFDIATLVNAISDLDLSGYSDAEGTVRGTFKNPEIIVNANARETGYSFMSFGKSAGLFQIKEGNLSYEGTSPPGTEYFSSAKVFTKDIFKKSRQTSLKAEFKNLEASELLLNPEIKGKISGTYAMEAFPQGRKTGELNAKIAGFEIYGFHFPEIESLGKLENQTFTLSSTTFRPLNYDDKLIMYKPAVFSFNEKGWTVDGEILPGVTLKGGGSKAKPHVVELVSTLSNTDLRPILASLGLPQQESYLDGEVKMSLGLDKYPTTIDFKISRFVLPMEEGEITNDGPVEVSIRPPKVDFKRLQLLSGGERFAVRGSYTMDGPIDLILDGKLDLGVLVFLPEYFREGSGYAKLNLKVGGNFQNPRPVGDITFDGAGITLRPIRGEIENLEGTIRLAEGSAIFDKLQGTMREGDILINGRIDLENFKPKYYDLALETREVAISEPGVYKIIFSGNLSLKGPAANALFSGNIDINDGAYIRNFNITESLIKPQETQFPEKPSPFLKNIVLDLSVKSPGELAINNNIAYMQFNSDIRLTGPALSPRVSGALEVVEGEFHYFTIAFQDARGVIDFRNPARGPYVDVSASKEFASTSVSTVVVAHIQGFTDNLQLNFSSSPPLAKRDILSLVFTGSLPGGRSQGIVGTTMAASVLTSQLGQVIQGPTSRKARLDIFRLEASDPERSEALTTLVVGKKLSERLTLQFRSDLGVNEPVQGVQLEYLLIDNVLIKGTQLSDGVFNFNLALRFKLN
jgi:autotransporter translocation and assembly factor TamB